MEPADKQQLLQTGPDGVMKQHSGGVNAYLIKFLYYQT